MYDIVWYTQDRMQDAERVLKRLPLDEVLERDCPDLCMSQDGVPIPGQSAQGKCVCANFLGASDCLALGATPQIASLCDLTDHGLGLVGGSLKASFWLSSGLKAAEEIASEREWMLRAMKPPSARQLFRCARIALGTAIVSAIACVFAIPRSFNRVKPRKIRSLPELEIEAARLLGAFKRGI